MISYKEKQERYSKLEKTILNKHSLLGTSSAVIMADIILSVQKDELLRQCEFIFQFYNPKDKTCVDDVFVVVRGDEISNTLDKYSKNDYRFSFYLAQGN